MTDDQSTAIEKLLSQLNELNTVNVEWAPAHGAPFFSKTIVITLVEFFIPKIEAEAVTSYLKGTEKDER